MKLTIGRQRQLFKLLSVLLIIVGLANAQSASAEQRRWAINVTTSELKQQFVYKNTVINPVAKIDVDYGEELKVRRPFEAIYYYDGKPIGLERKGPFAGIGRGDLVSVRVTHKERGGAQESKAIANTILRLTLNATHNLNPIMSISVPRESFEQIIGELEKRNCLPTASDAEKVDGARLRFNIVSEPQGLSEHLYYTPNNI